VQLGQSPQLFWTLTLREIETIIAGALAARRSAHNERAWLAHTIAYLSVYHPSKSMDFVKLEKLTVREDLKAPIKSDWKQQFAKVQAWAARSHRKTT
jgi:predicted transposase YbfD/YdcC